MAELSVLITPLSR